MFSAISGRFLKNFWSTGLLSRVMTSLSSLGSRLLKSFLNFAMFSSVIYLGRISKRTRLF